MTDTPEVAAARIEAERAKGRMTATAHELQERLSPKTIARGTWQSAKEKGADLAEDAVDAVRARPVAASGVVAALALFVAREPLIDLAARLMGGGNGKTDKRKKSKSTEKKTETAE